MSIEETDGPLAEPPIDPSVAQPFAQLQADHARIRSQIAGLSADVATASSDDLPALLRIREQASSVLEEMQTHEDFELRVIQGLFWRGVGSPPR